MLENIISAFWFFLPAGLANSSAEVISKLPFFRKFNYPMDFYKTYRGKRVFGSHKTVRGLVAGTLFAILMITIQKILYLNNPEINNISLIDYSQIDHVLLGFLLGFGALMGDAIKSFLKRQLGIPPGKSWVPFDQIDFIVGGLTLSSLYIQLSISNYITIAVVYIVLHPLSNITAYLLKIQEKPL